MKKNKISPEKWIGVKESYKTWWEGLSDDKKREYKNHYEKVREWNSKQKSPFPNMYDTVGIRVSKLSDKQLYRIWVFRDKVIN